jgi:hypothetical protein
MRQIIMKPYTLIFILKYFFSAISYDGKQD